MVALMRKFAHEAHRIDVEAVAQSPRLHRKLAIFALAIVLISSQIGMHVLQTSNAQATEKLAASGAHFMTGTELLASYVRSNSDVKPYWLGESQGFSYSGTSITQGRFVIGCIESNPGQLDSINENYEIITYINPEALKSGLDSRAFTDKAEMTTLSGRRISFYQGDMRRLEVGIPGTDQVVVMNFEQPESLSSLLTYADALRPLV